MRFRTLTTTFDDCDVVEQIDEAENAGDEFECLADNDCGHPGGHLFRTHCGETICLYCGRIAWR